MYPTCPESLFISNVVMMKGKSSLNGFALTRLILDQVASGTFVES